MNNLFLAIILSFLPISELRGGLPIAIKYALDNNLSISLIFIIIILTNILAIFFVFFFLDFLHVRFMKINAYKRFFSRYIRRIEVKGRKVEKKIGLIGYLALMLFVAIPLPTTGAWTGSVIAWFLKLDRRKSIISIASGVILAGFIVLLITLGILNLL
jgi:uncharacterized membrane protein